MLGPLSLPSSIQITRCYTYRQKVYLLPEKNKCIRYHGPFESILWLLLVQNTSFWFQILSWTFDHWLLCYRPQTYQKNSSQLPFILLGLQTTTTSEKKKKRWSIKESSSFMLGTFFSGRPSRTKTFLILSKIMRIFTSEKSILKHTRTLKWLSQWGMLYYIMLCYIMLC